MTDQISEDVQPVEEPTASPEAEAAREDSPNREAAKYRRQLRDTQAERDQLLEVVTTYRRTEAERAAEDAGMQRGRDLFDLGTDLADLLGDDGRVDQAKVKSTVDAVLAVRPHWRRQYVDLDLGARSFGPVATASWQDVLNPRNSGRPSSAWQ